MFIKSLQINNYKCFTDKSIPNLATPNGERGSGLNILIGENGNGKTTILESINYLTLNSYSAENKININDFNDFREEIKIEGEMDEFKCKSSIDFYKDWYFISKGLEFTAKSRQSKERNKLLSKSFDLKTRFLIQGNYIGGKTAKEVDSRDKSFNNSQVDGDGVNVFYFDKNRNRQLTTGNYKTTFEKILDDLNWRFRRDLTPEREEEIVRSLCSDFFKQIERVSNANAGIKTGEDFEEFFEKKEYSELKIDLLNILAPYSNAFFSIRKENELNQIQIKDLGSGVEIVLTLLLLRNISNASKGKIIYLIDEPELHLHPKAQEKLLDLLLEESKDKQIFISTHSPYMFRGSIGEGANLLLCQKDENDEITIVNARGQGWGLFGDYSPTWGEINWFAYNLPTIEFHNELYGYLQSKAIEENEVNEREVRFDMWLISNNLVNMKEWIKEVNGEVKPPVNRTLQTFIRNSIHHPENSHNEKYKSDELKNSIEEMITLLRTL